MELFFSGIVSPSGEELDSSDDDEFALREAIRLSQLDQMSDSDLRKREEEEFEKVKYFHGKCLCSLEATFAVISLQNST